MTKEQVKMANVLSERIELAECILHDDYSVGEFSLKQLLRNDTIFRTDFKELINNTIHRYNKELDEL